MTIIMGSKISTQRNATEQPTVKSVETKQGTTPQTVIQPTAKELADRMYEFHHGNKRPAPPPPAPACDPLAKKAKLDPAVALNQRLQRCLAETQQQLDQTQMRLQYTMRELMCPQCNKRRRDTVLFACAHLAGCHDCCKRLQVCPVCQNSVTGFVRINSSHEEK